MRVDLLGLLERSVSCRLASVEPAVVDDDCPDELEDDDDKEWSESCDATESI